MKLLIGPAAIFVAQLLLLSALAIIPSYSVRAQATSAQPPQGPPAQTVKVVNSPSEPVPVTGAVNVGNTVNARMILPAGAFTVSGSGPLLGPDPAGTSYAITSITVTNHSTSRMLILMRASYGTTSDCSVFGLGTEFAIGPVVSVPGQQTVHLTFPQPFTLEAKAGTASCLELSSTGDSANYMVVGYRY